MPLLTLLFQAIRIAAQTLGFIGIGGRFVLPHASYVQVLPYATAPVSLGLLCKAQSGGFLPWGYCRATCPATQPPHGGSAIGSGLHGPATSALTQGYRFPYLARRFAAPLRCGLLGHVG